ncbi:hypothetical protein [Fimbriiglobus ruber]|uniref:Uncharacterized protein n=1 Tax=Fimbriiglobus ruber TaxID=1908690 RepID=A0A225CZ83_9BACT|nr:hypothetical protein [Fimbriiglobus ruber]OWK34680.1 hypothetical protein FRUB_09522 [Fimbriiglobus ruber]
MPAARLFPALVLVAGLSAAGAFADDRADAVKKQKETAADNLKAANLKMASAETADLLVFASLPEDKAKSLGAALQKVHDTGAKALTFDPPSNVWGGKLSIYVITDQKKYKTFLLDALRQVPQGRETYRFGLRADAPYILDGIVQGDKPSDVAISTEAAVLVAGALLNKKAGTTATTNLPEWLQTGFGRATLARSDAAKLAAFKSKVRALYNKTRGEPFKPSWVWGDSASPDRELVASSFAEYLAFGPVADKFPLFLGAFKPDENGTTPGVDTAFTAADWKADDLEAGWKKWVMTGK